jgi:hypothetical protein
MSYKQETENIFHNGNQEQNTQQAYKCVEEPGYSGKIHLLPVQHLLLLQQWQQAAAAAAAGMHALQG